MYILFISSGGIWQMADVIFFFNLIIIVIKKMIKPMSSTRPIWIGSKNLLNPTQPNSTHAHS